MDCMLSRPDLQYRVSLIHRYAPNRAVPLCRLCRHLPFTEGESTPSPKGRLTDTENVNIYGFDIRCSYYSRVALLTPKALL